MEACREVLQNRLLWAETDPGLRWLSADRIWLYWMQHCHSTLPEDFNHNHRRVVRWRGNPRAQAAVAMADWLEYMAHACWCQPWPGHDVRDHCGHCGEVTKCRVGCRCQDCQVIT